MAQATSLTTHHQLHLSVKMTTPLDSKAFKDAKHSIKRVGADLSLRGTRCRNDENRVMGLLAMWLSTHDSLPDWLNTAESIRMFVRWVAPQANKKAIEEKRTGFERHACFVEVFEASIKSWMHLDFKDQAHVKKSTRSYQKPEEPRLSIKKTLLNLRASASGSSTGHAPCQLPLKAAEMPLQTGQ